MKVFNIYIFNINTFLVNKLLNIGLTQNEGLTQEKLSKIMALQIKFDLEIKNLANECNLEPEFIKV